MKIRNRIGFLASFGIVLVIGTPIAQSHLDSAPVVSGSNPSLTAPSWTEKMITKHNCWTGDAPVDMVGKIPGHVVAEAPGDSAATYHGPKMVSKALDQIFEGADHGLTIYAFCR